MVTVFTTKDNDLSKVNLSNPESSNGVIFVDVNIDTDKFYIQTPRLKFGSMEVNGDIKLILDNEKKTETVNDFYNIIRNVEDKVCNELHKNSKQWFPNELPLDIISNHLFRTSIKLPTKIGEPLSLLVNIQKETEVFDSSKQKVDIKDIFQESIKECTFLLGIKELNITSNQASLVWEVEQILTHKKKNKIKGFKIKLDPIDPPEKLIIGVIPSTLPEPKANVSKDTEEDTEGDREGKEDTEGDREADKDTEGDHKDTEGDHKDTEGDQKDTEVVPNITLVDN